MKILENRPPSSPICSKTHKYWVLVSSYYFCLNEYDFERGRKKSSLFIFSKTHFKAYIKAPTPLDSLVSVGECHHE